MRTSLHSRPPLLVVLAALMPFASGWSANPLLNQISHSHSGASAASTTALQPAYRCGTIQCRAPPAALAIGFLGGPLVGGLMTYLILGKIGLYELAPLKEIGRLSLATAPEAHFGVRFELIGQFYLSGMHTTEWIPTFCSEPSHAAWCAAAGL